MIHTDTLIDLFSLGMKREIIPPVPMSQWPRGLKLNLGAGNTTIGGVINLDLPEWDAEHDPIPYGTRSVAGIHAYHFLEHVERIIPLLAEMQRVLMPGAYVNICVPYYTSQIAHHDLTHRHFFTETTWDNLFSNQYYKVPGTPKEGWLFKVRTNIIMGVVERNLALLTQLQVQ